MYPHISQNYKPTQIVTSTYFLSRNIPSRYCTSESFLGLSLHFFKLPWTLFKTRLDIQNYKALTDTMKGKNPPLAREQWRLRNGQFIFKTLGNLPIHVEEFIEYSPI